MTAIGRSGRPRAFACARPSVVNAVEQIAIAALPRFAASTLSWTLHDAQDPQSPEPVMTTSQASLTSRSISGGAGMEAADLRRLTMALTP